MNQIFQAARRAIAVLATTLVFSAAAQPESGWTEQLDQRLEKALRGERVTGAAMIIVDREGPVFTRAYGYADRSHRQPMTTATRFPLANITKIVTAVAVLQQVQSGRLNLDQPASRYLPGLAIESRFAEPRTPTLRQLLSHHSGLPSNVLAGIYAAQPATALMPAEDLYLAHPPGTIYGYSNRAYVLLGHVLEAVTGLRYDEVIHKQVLDPLGMTGADFKSRAEDALGHSRRGKVLEPMFPRDLPAMGLRGSIEDLGRLLHWVVRADPAPLLSAELRQEMSRAQNSDVVLDLDNRVGLGWQLTNTDNFEVNRALRVTATTLQFRGTVIAIPEHGVALGLLANSPESMDFVIDQARRAMDELLAQRAGLPLPDRDARQFPDQVALPAQAQDAAMQARYNTPLGLIEFTGNQERRDVAYLGKKFRASLRDDGWYDLSYRLFGLISIRFDLIRELLLRSARVGGHEVLLVNYQGRTFLFGTALSDPEAGDHLQALAGRYELSNPDFFSRQMELERITLDYDEGVLFGVYKLPLFMTLKPRIPLLEHRDHEYYVPGLGTAQGERLRYDPANQSLEFAGYRFQRLR